MSETPVSTEQARGRMLPGIAGIAMFLLFLTLVNVYGALTNTFDSQVHKYGVLALCTMLAVGIFGLLRMRRWGWSIVLAGCILLSAWYAYTFRIAHLPFFLVQAFFMLLFFLYLVRPEVRDRMR
jgi:lysylphosphatidylglycerol synthetase-like protein (DUF2156 family)